MILVSNLLKVEFLVEFFIFLSWYASFITCSFPLSLCFDSGKCSAMIQHKESQAHLCLHPHLHPPTPTFGDRLRCWHFDIVSIHTSSKLYLFRDCRHCKIVRMLYCHFKKEVWRKAQDRMPTWLPLLLMPKNAFLGYMKILRLKCQTIWTLRLYWLVLSKKPWRS